MLGCELDSSVDEIFVSLLCGARAALEALTARLDSAQNTFAILTEAIMPSKLLDARTGA
jgi:hypothetical protein